MKAVAKAAARHAAGGPGPGAEPALAVRGLVKRYGGPGGVAAVDGLDLELPRASVLALLGPNGAGKTTTVEVCTGFARADAGVVRVLGQDPATAPDALRARVGVMPQGGGAYPGVRAGEMLRLVAACARDPLDPAWLLDVLGLTGCARTPYKRLSGGQQQRLALACAVVGRPELVFLDEPTAGLDPQGRHLVRALVAALRRDGVAVLLTTHLMDDVEELADHVVIVDHGRVVARGTPAALTAGGEQELRFRARPGMDVGRLSRALPAGYRAAELGAGRYVVAGRIDPAALATITAWCAAEDAPADDVQVVRRSLEDVFLELTGRELRP
jgi:ABC-2 type transport system ATP-binding protein